MYLFVCERVNVSVLHAFFDSFKWVRSIRVQIYFKQRRCVSEMHYFGLKFIHNRAHVVIIVLGDRKPFKFQCSLFEFCQHKHSIL